MKTYSHAEMCVNVHSSAIQDRPKEKTDQMSISEGMDKQSVIYIYRGIIFRQRKEFWYMLQQGWTLKTLCWAQETRHKDHMVQDSIYTKRQEQANLCRSNRDEWLPTARWGVEHLGVRVQGCSVSFGGAENVLKWMVGMFAQLCECTKHHWLCILNGELYGVGALVQ